MMNQQNRGQQPLAEQRQGRGQLQPQELTVSALFLISTVCFFSAAFSEDPDWVSTWTKYAINSFALALFSMSIALAYKGHTKTAILLGIFAGAILHITSGNSLQQRVEKRIKLIEESNAFETGNNDVDVSQDELFTSPRLS